MDTITMVNNKKMEKDKFEEAIQEPHPMDGLNEKHTKFEHVNYLLELLCKEMGISPESQPRAVLIEISKVFEEYYKAKEAFTEMMKKNREILAESKAKS